MPPKIKITKTEIVKTALELVRQHGETALNARSIASALGCSTQPIFSNFATMDELQKEVNAAAHSLYLNFLKDQVAEGEIPPYKAMGRAYIQFAQDERELFKLLFMCDNKGQSPSPSEDFEASVELIMKSNEISHEQAMLMHLEMWACVHGIAVMLATSFFPIGAELISDMMTDIYKGLQTRHRSKE